MKMLILGALAAFGLQSQATAFPKLNNYLGEGPTRAAADLVSYDFEGIVALSNCSGSIVRFDDSLDTDKGIILTNGHCVKLIDPDVVIVDQSSRKSFTVLDSDANRIGRVYAEKLMYATMTKTDFALYQLRETYEEIREDFDVEALTLSREYPEIESNIEIISGYWRRGYSCQVEDIVFSLQEADWLFKDSIRYSRPGCEVIGGTSGSPAIDAETRMVIGVNNTINERGRECSINNPCEIDEDGNIFYERGIGYAQQTSWVYSCRDEDGAFDLNVEGCLLPSPLVIE